MNVFNAAVLSTPLIFVISPKKRSTALVKWADLTLISIGLASSANTIFSMAVDRVDPGVGFVDGINSS